MSEKEEEEVEVRGGVPTCLHQDGRTVGGNGGRNTMGRPRSEGLIREAWIAASPSRHPRQVG